jgi:hypothetical protein
MLKVKICENQQILKFLGERKLKGLKQDSQDWLMSVMPVRRYVAAQADSEIL